MSGSYNYLCHKDVNDLMYGSTMLLEMLERLKGVAPESEATKKTQEVFDLIEAARTNIQSLLDGGLSRVWLAVEWADSGGWSDEAIPEAIKKYADGYFREG